MLCYVLCMHCAFSSVICLFLPWSSAVLRGILGSAHPCVVVLRDPHQNWAASSPIHPFLISPVLDNFFHCSSPGWVFFALSVALIQSRGLEVLSSWPRHAQPSADWAQRKRITWGRDDVTDRAAFSPVSQSLISDMSLRKTFCR